MTTTALNVACPWVKCVSDATYPRWQLVSFEYLDADHSGGDLNVYIWTKDATGQLRSNVAVMQHNGGDTKLLTKSEPGKVGEVDFAQTGNSSFDPNDGKVGPYSVDIRDSIPSDRVTGMGLPLSRHVVYKLTFQIVETAPQPEGQVEIKSVLLEPTTLTPNGTYGVLLRVTMTIYNGTSQPLQTQGPEPGKTYKEGETFQSIGFPESKGKYRVGLDFEGNTDIDHPYRWGLGEPLQPGATVTVDGFVELKQKSKKDYWAGLVEEQVRWVQDNIGRITVTVTESPARYKLHITCVGNGGVVVSPYADDYAAGTEVTLGATPFGSARFVEWTGGITTNPLVLTMDADTDITATFAEGEPQSEIEQRVAALEQGLANMVTELSGYHERADLLDSAIAELKTFRANIKAA